jgi:hypothetical protein
MRPLDLFGQTPALHHPWLANLNALPCQHRRQELPSLTPAHVREGCREWSQVEHLLLQFFVSLELVHFDATKQALFGYPSEVVEQSPQNLVDLRYHWRPSPNQHTMIVVSEFAEAMTGLNSRTFPSNELQTMVWP